MPAILQGAHCHPSEWPLTCRFSIPRRVKTAFCPCGVRSSGMCLVSATQVLDHVPRSPAECHCVQFPCCHPPFPASARQSLRHRPAAADGPRQARHIAAPQKSGLSGHFPRPCHGFWPRPARQNLDLATRPGRSLASSTGTRVGPVTSGPVAPRRVGGGHRATSIVSITLSDRGRSGRTLAEPPICTPASERRRAAAAPRSVNLSPRCQPVLFKDSATPAAVCADLGVGLILPIRDHRGHQAPRDREPRLGIPAGPG